MKKTFSWLSVIAVVMILTLPGQKTQARPVADYTIVSPTVKIISYGLARNGDLYEAVFASATIISPAGLLLTNSHVVLNEQEKPYEAFGICLSYDQNIEPACEYSADLLAYDKNLDLALLKLNQLDNRGSLMPALPYYDYHFMADLAIGETLIIYGYPAIGGKTLTQTSGQLSGYEDQNGIKYLKTDADISGGNSGGTALDSQGRFIGVPTYLLSSYENLGYILDIKQAQEFITSQLAAEPSINEQAAALLRVKLNLLNDAKDNNYYEHPYYPRFSLATTGGWEWQNIERTDISLIFRSNEGDKAIEISLLPQPFKISPAHMAELRRLINLYSDYLVDYQEEQTAFAGQPAIRSTFSVGTQKYYNYLIAYGYSLVKITYQADLDNLEADLAKYNQVLDTFKFIDQSQDNPYILPTFINNNPSFSISQIDSWYLQRNQDPFKKDLIVELLNPQAMDGQISISYSEINESEKGLTNQQALDKLVKSYQDSGNYKIISKNDSVKIDNLSGWSITYLTAGLEQDQDRKISQIYLRDGDYIYEIIYEDLLASYDANLPTVKEIIKTFKNYNQPAELTGKGEYALGSLDYAFTDISFHRYELAITGLADKGIVTGYSLTTFRPEKKITSSEVKRFISASVLVSKRANTNEQGDEFLTSDEVTLADALQALIQVYQLNFWENIEADAPVWKPYLDKGYEFGLIPTGLIDPNQTLTRAEFTYILNQLLESFKVI